MKCLRSGHCCIWFDVMIVDDPEVGLVENNIIHKPSGIKCQHLLGEKMGEHSCAIHDKPWYPETPCAAYTQVGAEDSPCRTGKYFLDQLKSKEAENA